MVNKPPDIADGQGGRAPGGKTISVETWPLRPSSRDGIKELLTTQAHNPPWMVLTSLPGRARSYGHPLDPADRDMKAPVGMRRGFLLALVPAR